MTEEQPNKNPTAKQEETSSPEDLQTELMELLRLNDGFGPTQLRCIELCKKMSIEQKVSTFNVLKTALTPEAIETLDALDNVHDLLGSAGEKIQTLVGDKVFDSIMNVVILARLNNVPEHSDEGITYNFSEEQQEKLGTILSTVPPAIHDEVLQLMNEPGFLNSDVMVQRERMKLVFSSTKAIYDYFKENEGQDLISEAEFNEIDTVRRQMSQLIGYMNNLKFK